MDDNVSDGSQSTLLTLTPSSSGDSKYNSSSLAQSLTTVTTDNDTVGLVLSKTAATLSESGTTDNFSVVLTSEPTANVTVTVSDNDTTEVSFSPTTLTFSSSDWSTAQWITLTGVDDNVSDDNQTTLLTLTTSGGDYGSVSVQTVTVTTSDNDTAGLTVMESGSGTTAVEGGDNDTFTVRLASRPTGSVVLSVQSSNSADVSVNPTTLSFDNSSSSWQTAQTVTVSAVNDAVDDDNVTSTITVSVNTSSTTDGKYALVSSDNLTVVTVSDNDTVGLVLSKSSGVVSENGSVSDNFSVVLSSQPTANVTLTLSDNDSTEVSATPSTLSFGSGNWSVAQWVTLTGKDDNVSDDNQTSLLGWSSSSSDSKYQGLSDNLSVTTLDNDTAGIVLSQDNVTVDERNGTDNFTVRLQSEPQDNVTLTVTDNDSTEVSLSPATLSFGPDNWSVAQTVVVSGVADSFDDGNQTSTITIASDNSTSDVKYDGLSSSAIATIQDNDTATVTIDNVSVSENATTATMVLRLTNAVSSSFTVNVSTSDGTARSSQYDYTAISSQTVSFAGNDNETQSVSISLTDDSQVEGSETLTLRMVSVSNSGVDISDTGTLTITDNDVATVTIADVSASESGGTATVTLVSDQSYGPGFTLDVSTADGTAFSPDDYTAVTSQTVSFAGNAGEQQTVSITLKSDTSIEGDESFTVSMSNPSNSEVLDISDNATVTITDDDTATLTIADRTVNEGDNVTLTLSLSSAPALPWTVVVSTVDGSAVAGSSGDYTSFSETVSFGFGVTSKTISIASIEDNLAEDNETFVVRLDNSSVSSVNITDNATVTIIDDEARPEVTLTPSASTVSEGAGTLTLTATQSQVSAANTVVSLSFSGNATRSSDYSVSENITIVGGSLSGNVTLSLVDDNTTEASEAIVVDIASVSGGNGASENGTQQATITLTDNDPVPEVSLSVSPSSLSENGGSVTLTASLDRVASSATVVSLSFDNSTASSGDYTLSSSTLTIAAGSLSENATLTGVDDNVTEGTETIKVDVSSVSGGNGATDNATQQTITLTDDDTASLVVSADNVTVSETGTTSTFTVKLNSEPTSSVTVSLGLNGSDEFSVSDNLSFSSSDWNTVKTVTVTGADDDVADDNQTSTLTLSSSSSDSYYNGLSDNVTVTTTDNDTVGLVLSGTNATVSENGTTSTFTVQLNSAPTANVTLSLSDNDTTEVLASPTTLTFSSGNWSTSQVITLTGVDDNVSDGSQSTLLTLSPSGGDYGSVSAQTLTVTTTDNDTAGFNLSKGTASVAETGTTDNFSVVLTSEPTANVTVTVSDNDTTEVLQSNEADVQQ